MAVDCSNLERQMQDIIDRKVQLMRDNNDLFQDEYAKGRKVEEIKQEMQSIDNQGKDYDSAVKQFEQAIQSAEVSREPLNDRVSEYQKGIDALRAKRESLDAERRAATEPADIKRFDDSIGMVDIAITEHKAGIQQMRSALDGIDSYISTVRESLQQTSDEWHSLAAKRQSLGADLVYAERDAAAAADRAGRARDELARLEEEIERTQQELNECYRRRNEERERTTATRTGRTLRP
jgi:chromosome segregation ATPase